MAASDDLVDFDLIEGQKENIQSLPGGRSARKLAELYSPSPLHKLSTPTPTDTKNVNDCIRAEYEAEVQALSESDDPLDVYDRYVRWTLDAYPSAQATPQSQLHTLLERATKTFITSAQYKNDPRYLKLWLHYIQFFSDSPRETYVFLSRHAIGEGLALFYEEFAAWLESAQRWGQAEEVYKLGIEREARPVQRLLRKFKEFEERVAQNPDADLDRPSSPALPLARPALAAKLDPFGAGSSVENDPQAPAPRGGAAGGSSKPTKSKLAIFSDSDAKAPALGSRGEDSKGWDSIGSLADRKKENTIEPKPWVGETLKAGGKKADGPKMMVFRDTSLSKIKNVVVVVPSKHQVTVHPQTGKKECIVVDLAAIYPTPDEQGTERGFEELMAEKRGWMDCSWEDDTIEETRVPEPELKMDEIEQISSKLVTKLTVHRDENAYDENGAVKQVIHDPRPTKKKKVMDVNETQIIKAKLDSPSGPKMRKKNMSEPTMTIHTKAATDDIYDIFNAPLKQAVSEDVENGYESDDYTTDAESVDATRQIESEHGDEDGDEGDDDAKSASEWSEFSMHRQDHDFVEPAARIQDSIMSDPDHEADVTPIVHDHLTGQEDDFHTPDSPPKSRTTFVPIPPEDYDPPTRPYRDPVEMANNRLPFMTPITERTETGLDVETRAYHYKTPCKRDANQLMGDYEEDLEPLSSPLREIVEEDEEEAPMPRVPTTLQPKVAAQPVPRNMLGNKAVLGNKVLGNKMALGAKVVPKKGPIILDKLCNPLDNKVRAEIMSSAQPPMSSYRGFYDHREENYERGAEIRKFVKALQARGPKAERNGSLPAPVNIELPDVDTTYGVRRMLGEGAFAPVYLVENTNPDGGENDENAAVMGRGTFSVNQRSHYEALKMETPPTPWEFYMMRLAHSRLGQHRAAESLTYAHELHLYKDEAFLFMPYHPNGTLLDVVNHYHAEPSGVMDEQLAMFFAVELLRTIETLHSKGVIHGDIKVDNCLLRLDPLADGETLSSQWKSNGRGGWAERGLTLIDIGRGIDMKAFVPDVEFFADWKTSEQDCAEMREARPWTWQIDYFGLAGTIHCLLFGKYIDTVRVDQGGIGKNGRRYKIRESLKRYWQTEIWGQCFEVLLNPAAHCEAEDGAKMPVLKGMRSVRENMEAWLESNSERGVGLKSLMNKLENWAKMRK